MFDEKEIGNLILEDYHLRIIVFEIESEVIVKWID